MRVRVDQQPDPGQAAATRPAAEKHQPVFGQDPAGLAVATRDAERGHRLVNQGVGHRPVDQAGFDLRVLVRFSVHVEVVGEDAVVRDNREFVGDGIVPGCFIRLFGGGRLCFGSGGHGRFRPR
ncbi:hypothetical protein H4696_006596 [Amycolatopsis lexingtonensis]|uniref:Uncharacterized protein n=1 Tax=Amycolatopsis lexingtonensis TaxID=218822 RepID=A0ABR9I8L7_9PSEU|nr:hypothetical protein [Amycolatopsis lexingtonensis]MBE1499496.1 hypothetical protein [Amycolatopsis lexingtonensis]